ncbi:hypothetical protein RCL1_008722 [Eukaryota sp. TZLM3-RCL]
MGNVVSRVCRRFRQNRRFRRSSQVSPGLQEPASIRRRTSLTPVVSSVVSPVPSPVVTPVPSPIPIPIPQPPIGGVIPPIGSISLSDLILNAPLPPNVTRPVLANRNLV